MTRVEELTTRLIDGEASPDERGELGRLVDEDPDARRVMVTLLHAEGMLRGGRAPDVSGAVMARIRASEPARAPAARPARRRRWWPLALTLTLGTAFALFGVWRARIAERREATGARPAEPSRTPPRLDPAAARAPGADPGAEGAPGASPPHASDPAGVASGETGRARRAAAPPPPADRGPLTVLSMDFEDGSGMGVIHGRIVGDACPPGSRHCALGGMSFGRPEVNAVTIERSKPPLARYGHTLVVTFDYWIDRDQKSLTVQVWNQDRKQNYHLSLNDAAGGGWARAQARLVDFVPNVRRDEPMEEGDELQNMMIKAGRMGGPPLYVDNIKILEYRPDSLPGASTARAPRN